MSETIAVRAEGLYKVFGRRPQEAVNRLEAGATRDEVAPLGTAAVINASFEVHQGEIFVVMGLSGSGKSTLIRMLNGLLDSTSGSVQVFGTEIVGIDPKPLRDVRRKHLSMVFQHFALLPHRTVRDNAAYGLEVQGVPLQERRRRAEEILGKVGLEGWGDMLPGQLSGGMQQRVGLARALAADTDVLLMDEAFSALDPLIRREMQEQLVGLQAELDKTIIFITHDLNEAMYLGDRIAVMRDGRIVQVGTPEEILTDPANDYVEQFVQDVDRTRVLTAANVMERVRADIPLSGGPRAALKVMRDLQTSAVFVTEERKLLGAVRDRDVIRLIKKSGHAMADIIDGDLPTVTPETPLVDLFEVAVANDLPVPVVDQEGRLVGAIPTVTLLSALGNVGVDTGELPTVDPPPTVPVDIITEALEDTENAADSDAQSVDSEARS